MDTDKTSAEDDPAGTAGVAGADAAAVDAEDPAATDAPREINGPKGPEPTRYGDWEQKGRCSDF